VLRSGSPERAQISYVTIQKKVKIANHRVVRFTAHPLPRYAIKEVEA